MSDGRWLSPAVPSFPHCSNSDHCPFFVTSRSR
uniref:Uncharacterized protein n=1 Tax=Rhizophora mucronata TaxID=61149 RepID=A0A2P2Q2I7_RHIMU